MKDGLEIPKKYQDIEIGIERKKREIFFKHEFFRVGTA